MARVTDILTQVWDLPVLCPCIKEFIRQCIAHRMTSTITAMGITVHLHGERPPLTYTQPLGLASDRCLKYSVTLHSPWALDHKHISGMMVSAILNL